MDVPVLSRHAVDRRTAARADEAALDRAWADPATRIFPVTADGRAPLRSGRLAARSTAGPRPADAFYLGRDEEGDWFSLVVDELPEGPSGGLREVADVLDARDGGLFVHAIALLNWHAGHNHCPRCGTPTDVFEGGHVRRCPRDGSSHFPRTDPAVIMLITDPTGAKVLLGRQHSWPSSRFSCLAGFVEPGEAAEQAVVRETYEETAVTVRDVRYVASQPWPFPASLMLGFRGTADPAQQIDVGEDELAEARWFDRRQVRDQAELTLPGSVSIARLMIEGWLAEGSVANPG